jgi:polysaccharide pyruvyl transferase WcaK-like protein
MGRFSEPPMVRDVLSYQTLKRAQVDAVQVSDCVFTTEALFREERARSKDGGKRVYVSVIASGDTTAQGLVDLMDRLRQLSYEPVLFSSCEVDDRKLVDEVMAIRKVDYLAPNSWKASVRLFAEAAFVITNRLHCLIFSALGGAAVIPITNRKKTKAYAADAELLIGPESICALSVPLLEEVAKTLPTIRSKQAKYLGWSARRTESVIRHFGGFRVEDSVVHGSG